MGRGFESRRGVPQGKPRSSNGFLDLIVFAQDGGNSVIGRRKTVLALRPRISFLGPHTQQEECVSMEYGCHHSHYRPENSLARSLPPSCVAAALCCGKLGKRLRTTIFLEESAAWKA
jgi:hypothetical protein